MMNSNPFDARAVPTIHLMILASMADTDAAVARWGMADTDAAVARCGMVAAMALTSVLNSAKDAAVAMSNRLETSSIRPRPEEHASRLARRSMYELRHGER